MRKFSLLFAFIFTLYACGQKVENWYSLIATNNGYQIDFPKQPTYGEREINNGQLIFKFYQLESWKEGKDKNLSYVVGFTEFPDSIMSSKNTNMISTYLDGATNETVSRANAKILNEKNITLGNYPGREIHFEIGDGTQTVTTRFYLVNNILFQIQVMTEIKNDNNESTTKFLDSFKLIE